MQQDAQEDLCTDRTAEQQDDPLPFQSPLLNECYTASIQGRVGLGAKAGAYVHREGRMPNAPYMEFITGRRCAQIGGGHPACERADS